MNAARRGGGKFGGPGAAHRGGRGGGGASRQQFLDRAAARADRLRKMCHLRHINLRIMPNIMLKRKRNRSHYSFKERNIYWTVMWLFPQALNIDNDNLDERKSEECEEGEAAAAGADVAASIKTLGVLHHSVSESFALEDSFKRFISSRWRDAVLRKKLANYYAKIGMAENSCERVGFEDISDDLVDSHFVYLIRKTDSPACKPEFYLAKSRLKLVDFLAWTTMVEFPEIIVEFKGNEVNYRVVEKIVREDYRKTDRVQEGLSSSASSGARQGDNEEGAFNQEEDNEEGGAGGRSAVVVGGGEEEEFGFDLHVHPDPEVFHDEVMMVTDEGDEDEEPSGILEDGSEELTLDQDDSAMCLLDDVDLEDGEIAL
eukprot:TRINITY_DN5587_c0_g1_i1.p1 TRINITY_DN5587_c0_g1~~TRINITY_DN5587_c0_g1_i1.p1  ORF type:complete len:407 (-),score=128.82 TRINITY_DN5587_c0_g1_i1:30-1145(-)